MKQSSTGPTSVYLYHDEYDILLYVGITGRGVMRQREHNADKEWWPLVKRQYIEHFDTRDEASEMERRLIGQHHPPFNTTHNDNASVHRANYQAFRANICAQPDVVGQAQLLDRRLPVYVVANENVRGVQFITDPRYPVVGRNLYRVESQRTPVNLSLGGKVGVITKVTPINYGALIDTSVRHFSVPDGHAGYVQFITPNTARNKQQRAEIRSLILDYTPIRDR